MKKYWVLAFVPLAIACNKFKSPESAIAPIEETVAEVPAEATQWAQVAGQLEFKEKCPQVKEPGSCLIITGGDDLNDSKIFYLRGGDNGTFEPVASDDELKKFRIHMEPKGEEVLVSDKEHVTVLAKLDPTLESDIQEINAVRSLRVVEK